MSKISIFTLVVLLSELISLLLLFKYWRSEDFIIFKIVLTVISLIPIFGPLALLWLGNWPDSQPKAFRDESRYRSDVWDRWRHVFEEKDSMFRRRKIKGVLKKGEQE